MSTLRRRQLRKLIESQGAEIRIPRQALSRDDLQAIINEEIENLNNEGFLKNVGAAAARWIPGGGTALDFARSRGFDKIEEKLQELEMRLAALEQRSP